MQAVDGKKVSAVTVATIIRSSSLALMPPYFSAFFEASMARSDVAWFSPAIRRSFIPVRSVIHASVVGTIFSKSKFVSTFSGTYDPVATMRALSIPYIPSIGGESCPPSLTLTLLNFFLCILAKHMSNIFVYFFLCHLGRHPYGIFYGF